MNVRKYTLSLLGLMIISHIQLSAKAIFIPVDWIFNHTRDISKIKVIGYTGDTIMNYIDLESKDTLKFDCFWKNHSESSIKTIKEHNPFYNSWEGTFPKVGEIILMLTYEYDRNRILFARREKNYYRFWDPSSIPFANSVFIFAKNGIYKPTESCYEYYPKEAEFRCSDGFLIEEKEFEKIKAKR